MELRDVHTHAALSRLVRHVEREDNGLSERHELEREEEVPLEVGEVYDIHNYVDAAALKKIHGDLFGVRAPLQVINTGEVDYVEVLPFERKINFGLFYSDPGPVPHLEVLTGDLVEDCSLAYIRVPSEPYGNQS